MTEEHHFNSSSKPLCICLYLGLNPLPLCSHASVLPNRPQWQISNCAHVIKSTGDDGPAKPALQNAEMIFCVTVLCSILCLGRTFYNGNIPQLVRLCGPLFEVIL